MIRTGRCDVIRHAVSIFLWAVGSLFFIPVFFIVVLSIFFLPRKKTADISRILSRILIRLMGIRLKVSGQGGIQPGRRYLIMGNHQSLFDLFVIPAAIPVCFVGVEAARHFSYPIFGYLIKKWGNIPIQRKNLKQARESLRIAAKTIEAGMNIVILPEGGRTLTGKMKPFKKGPFHLAKAAGADILPYGVKGLYQYNKKGSYLLTPGEVVVTIGPPVSYEKIKDYSVEELRDLIFETIEELSRS